MVSHLKSKRQQVAAYSTDMPFWEHSACHLCFLLVGHCCELRITREKAMLLDAIARATCIKE